MTKGVKPSLVKGLAAGLHLAQQLKGGKDAAASDDYEWYVGDFYK
jgi:hypothetical protein